MRGYVHACGVGLGLGLALASCGGAAPAVGGLPNECRLFQTNVEEIYSEDARVALETAAADADTRWMQASYRRVRTSMDQVSEDWVRLSEQACVDLHVHGGSQRVYQGKRACFDEFLLTLRTHVTQLSALDPEGVRAAVDATAALRADVASCVSEAVYATYQPTPASGPAAEVALETARARTQRRLGKPSDALPLAEHASGSAETLGDTSLHAGALVELGLALHELDRFDAARGAFTHARRLASASGAVVAERDAAAGLGLTHLAQARVQDALRELRAALALATRMASGDDADVARGAELGRAHRNLGQALLDAGDTTGARREFDAALAIDRRAYGGEHPDIARALFNLGVVALMLDDGATAAERMRDAIGMLERLMGDDHPNVAQLRSTYAIALQATGGTARALEEAQRAHADLRASFPQHSETARAQLNLGWVLDQQGQREAAQAAYEGALPVLEASLGAQHPDVARALFNIGKLRVANGAANSAVAPLERALAILEAAEVADPALLDEVRAALAAARQAGDTP